MYLNKVIDYVYCCTRLYNFTFYYLFICTGASTNNQVYYWRDNMTEINADMLISFFRTGVLKLSGSGDILQGWQKSRDPPHKPHAVSEN